MNQDVKTYYFSRFASLSLAVTHIRHKHFVRKWSRETTQLNFTYSKLPTETLEKGMK